MIEATRVEGHAGQQADGPLPPNWVGADSPSFNGVVIPTGSNSHQILSLGESRR